MCQWMGLSVSNCFANPLSFFSGAGGMADTRDPDAFEDKDDPRKSISDAPSFEEYMKQRQNQ